MDAIAGPVQHAGENEKEKVHALTIYSVLTSTASYKPTFRQSLFMQTVTVVFEVGLPFLEGRVKRRSRSRRNQGIAELNDRHIGASC
jgi:hypothetical protein